MRLAYQGEPGAYSEAAARVFSPHADTLPCKTFDEVFEAVVEQRATHGIVPMENSVGGTIHRNYDLLVDHEIPITGEVELDVVHCLQALPGTTIETRPMPPSTATTLRIRPMAASCAHASSVRDPVPCQLSRSQKPQP